MKSTSIALLAAALSLSAATAFADPTCTTEPKSAWQDQEVFKQSLLDQGYKIKKFKETDTGCYEIYGWNSQGQKVEIYFNPVNGEAVKTEID
ncbi:PepSY domain-containing protein [Hahella aquimaris]|uniref:PepSY domain-containing protein n=1 Tax=Hahella sp. HNIBRBA332 TaxID=3015983 RepID=UPI00273AE112|nr:PepSY domain-containing protein [Hahella sp. HNIBRBA332]WLQ13158.1 PepSY domain-containing protein [Hahella sp. HNIBRBA332]